MPEPLPVPMVEPPISVSSAADRPTAREQIEDVLARARAKGDPLRIRLPFSLYDQQADSRTYVFIRDATWNLALPSEHATPETVEKLIYAIGRCIVAIANEGSDAIVAKLTGGTTPS